MAQIAEFERGIISERTKAAMAAAMARGQTFGKAMSKREKATKAKSYTGILNEPMPLLRNTVVGRTIEEQKNQRIESLQHRVGALFNHYGIDPAADNAWINLALSLAHDHVPGFQFGGKKPGAPYKRAEDDVTIYFEVKRLLAEGKSINSACQIIEKRGFVKDLKASAIRQRYYDYIKEGKLGWHLDRMVDRVENHFGSETAKELFK